MTGFRPSHKRARLRAFVVPLMNISDRLVFALLVVMWLAAQLFFWSWWLRSAHTVTAVGMAFNTVLLAWNLVFPAVFLLHLGRAVRPDPTIPLPLLRVAMIVTKAPSEPWEVVRHTLSAMLRQDMPYAYDVWLADEAPSAETLRWCGANGIRLSTRQHRADYHREQWPRRTKCKEGNLAFFYDHWGYRDYDIVAQLDADHRPSRTYLREMVRPFADRKVGYVAAPSICDVNAKASWAARGRLYKEAAFHGPHQAGGHYASPPLCIGSHYAVRTEAVTEIGGIGPELAEDFSTTLMMNSFGWYGVFAHDAEAHGDGPETFADCVTQEFQWARSLTNIAVEYNRSYWRTLRLSGKLRLGLVELLYPLRGLCGLLACLLPIIALVTATPWAAVPLLGFFAHALTVPMVLFLAAAWTHRRGWWRPRNAQLISWEVSLYTITAWPWNLYGVMHSLVGWATGRRFGFKVTPKGIDAATPLSLNAVAPYLLISAGSAVTTLLIRNPGQASGYYYFCVLNAVVYACVAIAIVCLHLQEASRLSLSQAVKLAPAATAATLAVSGLAVAGLATRGGLAADTLLPPRDWSWVGMSAHDAYGFVLPHGQLATAIWLLVFVSLMVGLWSLHHSLPLSGSAGRLVLRRVGSERPVGSLESHAPFDLQSDLSGLIETLPSAVVIDWLRNGDLSGFGLTASDRSVGPVLTSALTEQASEPTRTPQTSRAHAILYDRLVAAGWEPYGRGGSWYSHQFRRPHPG